MKVHLVKEDLLASHGDENVWFGHGEDTAEGSDSKRNSAHPHSLPTFLHRRYFQVWGAYFEKLDLRRTHRAKTDASLHCHDRVTRLTQSLVIGNKYL